MPIKEQDKMVEDKILEILESNIICMTNFLIEKKQVERNVNICMYGKHFLAGDKDLKFQVTHCYHNNCDDLYDLEELKKEFAGETFENLKSMYMNLKVPLKIDTQYKTIQLFSQPGRNIE